MTLTCTGILPLLRRSIEVMCLDVFNVLYFDTDAQNDLSIPSQSFMNHDFDQTLSRVSFNFHKESNAMILLPMSFVNVDESPTAEIVSTVHIYFTEKEEQTSPEIIEARIVHEATHALRYAMIRCCHDIADIPNDRKETSTPTKIPRDRLNTAAADEAHPLYKLEDESFHSGYYVEHLVLGGVWVTMFGMVLDDDDCPVTLPAHGTVFKVIRKYSTKNEDKNGNTFFATFNGLEGVNQRGQKETVYHYDRLVARDQEGECTRLV